MTDDNTLSEELGTPLDRTDYTLEDINRLLQRNPDSVVDALVWTREQWKWFLPQYDEGERSGYDPEVWYDEAIRKLFQAISDIDNETGIYDQPDTYGIDPDWAGLIAFAYQYYQENYHHLRQGPEEENRPQSYQ